MTPATIQVVIRLRRRPRWKRVLRSPLQFARFYRSLRRTAPRRTSIRVAFALTRIACRRYVAYAGSKKVCEFDSDALLENLLPASRP